jgi:RNA polymerase sigma-70 factor (ECF subfamily)
MSDWLKKALHHFEHLSDSVLVTKAIEGDRDAFGKLYLRHLDAIYRYIFFRVNQSAEEAEDISEIVFFKAWQSLARFKEESGNFRAWIYRIAHNAVIDHYRKQNKLEQLTEDIESNDEDALERIDKENKVATVTEALKFLTDEQKQMVTLKFMNDLSNKEIAKLLGKNEEAIRAIQSRALKTLRKVLKNEE